jgi:hypothetical protein
MRSVADRGASEERFVDAAGKHRQTLLGSNEGGGACTQLIAMEMRIARFGPTTPKPIIRGWFGRPFRSVPNAVHAHTVGAEIGVSLNDGGVIQGDENGFG